MSEKEIIKCYAIYESKLGLNMTKSLGHSILSLYTTVVNHFFALDSKKKLTEDLKNDPLISESLGSITSHLYFKYGSILAPLAASMITYNHIKYSPINNNNINILSDHGNQSGTKCNTDRNYGETDTNTRATDSNCSATDSNRGYKGATGSNQEATIDNIEESRQSGSW